MDGSQHAAISAVRVGVISEAGVPQRIAVKPPAMLTIAFFHNHHSFITISIPDAYADRVDRAERLPGS